MRLLALPRLYESSGAAAFIHEAGLLYACLWLRVSGWAENWILGLGFSVGSRVCDSVESRLKANLNPGP